jgi:co-chaperonin GroES (HSP10)
VELDDLRDKSAGGIILPDSMTSRDSKATVIEAGYMVGMNNSGQYREDRISRGDRVIVMANALHHLFIPELDGVKSIKIVHEDGIVTRLLEDAPTEALASC